MNFLNGLMTINIELTSRCNKNCWMCGRRKIDKDYPNIKMNYGDMDFELVQNIAGQLPDNIVVQFHNNGEPFLYDKLGEALSLFPKQIRALDTNGKLLFKKKEEVINKLDSITISTFEKDEEWKEQYEILVKFLEYKKNKKPNVIIRVLGDVGEKRLEKYKKLDCLMAYRVLHSPMGSFKYSKRAVVPEHGFCLEMLNHPAINRLGDVSICVRFDPKREGVLGNLKTKSLSEIWNGEKRKEWLNYHKNGERKKVPLCARCEFWGIPRGY